MTLTRLALSAALEWSASQAVAGLDDARIGSKAARADVAFEAGTGAGQCDLAMEWLYEIAASGTQVVDLASFTELATGTTVGFQKVKALAVVLEAENADASTPATKIRIAPDATNGWAGFWESTSAGARQTVWSGTPYVGAAPDASGVAVSGTSKRLLITNLDASRKATVRVSVGGVKA